MTVGDLGEFALIERIRAALPPPDGALLVGVGDDAAVWPSGDGFVIATTDTMVAGVHFLPDHVAWQDVGWKALAVNVSDVAAMGGLPTFALVTLALPTATRLDVVDAIYEGLGECAATYDVTIAGGDIVRADELAITVALCGTSARASDGSPMLLRRDAARAGDLVAVTAPLGNAAGGLRVLREMLDAGERPPRSSDGSVEKAPGDPRLALVESHVHPWPRVDAGTLAVQAGIRCGMDISDGLVQDLGHICRASNVAVEVRADDVPIDDALRERYADARALALSGGEDYELLLVGGEGALRLADSALRRHLGLPDVQLHIVGSVVVADGSPRVRVVDASGEPIELDAEGWDHLRS